MDKEAIRRAAERQTAASFELSACNCSDMQARAYAAEDDLTAIRNGIREFQIWLREPVRGPIIFRAEVVERLNDILAL